MDLERIAFALDCDRHGDPWYVSSAKVEGDKIVILTRDGKTIELTPRELERDFGPHMIWPNGTKTISMG